MIGTIILWLVIIYIAIVILWRLGVSAFIIYTSYKEGGIKGGAFAVLGAIGMNLLMLLGDIWGLIKFAIVILIIILVMRACFPAKEKPVPSHVTLENSYAQVK